MRGIRFIGIIALFLFSGCIDNSGDFELQELVDSDVIVEVPNSKVLPENALAFTEETAVFEIVQSHAPYKTRLKISMDFVNQTGNYSLSSTGNSEGVLTLDSYFVEKAELSGGAVVLFPQSRVLNHHFSSIQDLSVMQLHHKALLDGTQNFGWNVTQMEQDGPAWFIEAERTCQRNCVQNLEEIDQMTLTASGDEHFLPRRVHMVSGLVEVEFNRLNATNSGVPYGGPEIQIKGPKLVDCGLAPCDAPQLGVHFGSAFQSIEDDPRFHAFDVVNSEWAVESMTVGVQRFPNVPEYNVYVFRFNGNVFDVAFTVEHLPSGFVVSHRSTQPSYGDEIWVPQPQDQKATHWQSFDEIWEIANEEAPMGKLDQIVISMHSERMSPHPDARAVVFFAGNEVYTGSGGHDDFALVYNPFS